MLRPGPIWGPVWEAAVGGWDTAEGVAWEAVASPPDGGAPVGAPAVAALVPPGHTCQGLGRKDSCFQRPICLPRP